MREVNQTFVFLVQHLRMQIYLLVYLGMQ